MYTYINVKCKRWQIVPKKKRKTKSRLPCKVAAEINLEPINDVYNLNISFKYSISTHFILNKYSSIISLKNVQNYLRENNPYRGGEFLTRQEYHHKNSRTGHTIVTANVEIGKYVVYGGCLLVDSSLDASLASADAPPYYLLFFVFIMYLHTALQCCVLQI